MYCTSPYQFKSVVVISGAGSTGKLVVGAGGDVGFCIVCALWAHGGQPHESGGIYICPYEVKGVGYGHGGVDHLLAVVHGLARH